MTYRNESLRRLVASLSCACCGREGASQAAHSNEYMHGHGRAIKSTDAAIFPLCADRPGATGCHTKFDQRIDITREVAAELTYRYIADTYIKLMEQGHLKVIS